MVEMGIGGEGRADLPARLHGDGIRKQLTGIASPIAFQ
jgi:hypothetical protein